MSIQPEEITRILKERLEGVSLSTEMKEVGSVLQVGDGIARVHGLGNAVAGEMAVLPEERQKELYEQLAKSRDAGLNSEEKLELQSLMSAQAPVAATARRL